jgi:ferritin-like metal-binding protein YciE
MEGLMDNREEAVRLRGTLKSWVLQLGKNDVAQFLEATLVEETKTDQALMQLAEAKVNPKGKQEAA